jgi:allantoicase
VSGEFTCLADLAAARFGGAVVAASDEFFAPKENLLGPDPPVARPGVFTGRGAWRDGWETRRRRDDPLGDDPDPEDHDWCLVRLGAPGTVRGVVVDTTHFSGNQPGSCALDGCAAGGYPSPAELLAPGVEWLGLLGRTALRADTEHRFAVAAPWRLTHVRLRIYPDGGVARLRVHGQVVPEPRLYAGDLVDLAAAALGGQVAAASDLHLAPARNLLLPGPARSTGDGWETRRRRPDPARAAAAPAHDWAEVRLAAAGQIRRVEVDTSHFKGNAPASCSLDARDAGAAAWAGRWQVLLPRTRLQPDTRHLFEVDGPPGTTHARLNIHPDGGVARLRLYGRAAPQARLDAGLRWLDALPPRQAEAELLACCGAGAWAAELASRRPFGGRGGVEALFAAAEQVWWALDEPAWLEAFAAHPRIGERRPGGRWSAAEQARAARADAATLRALADGNRAYEAWFGHVYLVCASGRSAAELLADLRARLGNDPPTELRVAAGEQAKIIRLRLEKLLAP